LESLVCLLLSLSIEMLRGNTQKMRADSDSDTEIRLFGRATSYFDLESFEQAATEVDADPSLNDDFQEGQTLVGYAFVRFAAFAPD
jgi:hypothetical protein